MPRYSIAAGTTAPTEIVILEARWSCSQHLIESIAGIPLPEGLQAGDRIDISNLGSPAHAALYSANGLFGLPLGVTYQLMRCS